MAAADTLHIREVSLLLLFPIPPPPPKIDFNRGASEFETQPSKEVDLQIEESPLYIADQKAKQACACVGGFFCLQSWVRKGLPRFPSYDKNFSRSF